MEPTLDSHLNALKMSAYLFTNLEPDEYARQKLSSLEREFAENPVKDNLEDLLLHRKIMVHAGWLQNKFSGLK